jgi:hypothetical protein
MEMLEKTGANLVEDARRGSHAARDELVRRRHREASLLAAAIVNDRPKATILARKRGERLQAHA